ncbi:MAG: hypothetical protein H6828_02020 [Planctomycetes bacterium]|nr:hypothetical protein [Planctomycetota bacterium]
MSRTLARPHPLDHPSLGLRLASWAGALAVLALLALVASWIPWFEFDFDVRGVRPAPVALGGFLTDPFSLLVLGGCAALALVTVRAQRGEVHRTSGPVLLALLATIAGGLFAAWVTCRIASDGGSLIGTAPLAAARGVLLGACALSAVALLAALSRRGERGRLVALACLGYAGAWAWLVGGFYAAQLNTTVVSEAVRPAEVDYAPAHQRGFPLVSSELRADGVVSLRGTELGVADADAWARAVRAAVVASPTLSDSGCEIAVDAAAPAGRVLELVDAARDAGFLGVGFLVRAPGALPRDRQLAVYLPRAATTAAARGTPGALLLELARSERGDTLLRVDGEAVGATRLAQRAAAWRAEQPYGVLALTTTPDVPFQAVAEALATCAPNGVRLVWTQAGAEE